MGEGVTMPIPLLGDIDDDTLFPALNLVLIGYGCICLVPSWRYTQPLVQGLVFCYSLLYALLIAHRLAAGPIPAGAGIDSLEAVVALFSDRNAVFAGWTHYIAFDLFVSSWIVRDARTSQIPHFCIVGMVPLTLMAGPAGLACYILFKSVWLKTVGPREQSNGRLCNTANSLTDQVQASYLRSPGLTVLYCAVTLLAGFMVLWVMVLPSSWLVGHSDFHDKMAGQIWDREGATPPTPKKFRQHRDFLYRHIGAGIWVAVQRLYVGALSTQIPLEQKMNFGDGAIIGAFITITMAEVAIRLTRNGEKSGAKLRKKEKDT